MAARSSRSYAGIVRANVFTVFNLILAVAGVQGGAGEFAVADGEGAAVVGDLGEIGRLLRAGEHVERRQAEGQHLRIVVVALDELQARLELVDVGDAPDALADVSDAAGRIDHLVEEDRRKEMIEAVDIAHPRLPDPTRRARVPAKLPVPAGARKHCLPRA